MHIRYLYLRDADQFPSTCVAYVIDRESNFATFGMATFNPHDKRVIYSPGDKRVVPDFRAHNQERETIVERYIIEPVPFERDFLREIAAGRLVSHRKTVRFNSAQCTDLHSVIRAIVEHIGKDQELPQRTKRAVKRWLSKDNKNHFDRETVSNTILPSKEVER